MKIDNPSERRKIAAELTQHYTAEELFNILQVAKQQTAEKNEKARRQAMKDIAILLENATNGLRRAGEIAAEHNIQFTFITPKSHEEAYGRWVHSACYASDGWFLDRSEYDGSVRTMQINTVEQIPATKFLED